VWASSHRQHSRLRAAVTIPGGIRPGLVLTCVIDCNGGLPGRWAAPGLSQCHHALNGLVHLSNRLQAPARAAVLPPACYLITAQSGT
jgi:hypothetical protein